MAKRTKYGEKYYTEDSCSTGESAANNRAAKLRTEGYNARVRKDGTKYCVDKRKSSAVSGKPKKKGKSSR
jgi:hypothetical protein